MEQLVEKYKKDKITDDLSPLHRGTNDCENGDKTAQNYMGKVVNDLNRHGTTVTKVPFSNA